jgi:metal-responsive CopG/Arc/MetJ family transcriptional regulator
MYSVRLPEELIAAVDERRELTGGLSRTQWTEKAITYLLSLPIRDRTIETRERI